MRRFLAAILALAMMASLSVAAFADDSGIMPYGGGGDYATMLNGTPSYEIVYIDMPVEDPKGTGLLVTLDIAEIFEDKDNFRAIPNHSTNWAFTFLTKTRVSKDGWAHYQCRIMPHATQKVEVGDVLEDTLSISLKNGDHTWQENINIHMTIVEGSVTNPDRPKPDDPNPDKPDRPDPTPGPAVDDDDDDNDSPTENKANDDKTKDDFDAGENVVLNLTNGSAAIRFDTMDALGASNGSLTIKNGKATITIPGGFGAVNEPGRIYYPFDCDSDFPYSEDVDETFRYGNDYSYEKAKIGANGTTLPTTAKVTLNTNLTGTVEVYKYDYMRRTYKLVTTTTENNGAVTFNTKEMGDFVLVQKGKTPTPVIPGDVNSAIAEINAERAKRGLPALQVDSKLMAAAAQRAKEQPISFGHTRPDGSQVNDSLPGEFGIKGVWENCGTMPTPGGIVAQWMDDPPHKDNLMASAPTKIGVGYCYDANSPYKNYWVFLATW